METCTVPGEAGHWDPTAWGLRIQRLSVDYRAVQVHQLQIPPPTHVALTQAHVYIAEVKTSRDTQGLGAETNSGSFKVGLEGITVSAEENRTQQAGYRFPTTW